MMDDCWCPSVSSRELSGDVSFSPHKPRRKTRQVFEIPWKMSKNRLCVKYNSKAKRRYLTLSRPSPTRKNSATTADIHCPSAPHKSTIAQILNYISHQLRSITRVFHRKFRRKYKRRLKNSLQVLLSLSFLPLINALTAEELIASRTLPTEFLCNTTTCAEFDNYTVWEPTPIDLVPLHLRDKIKVPPTCMETISEQMKTFYRNMDNRNSFTIDPMGDTQVCTEEYCLMLENIYNGSRKIESNSIK